VRYVGFPWDDFANHQSDAKLAVEDLDRAGLVIIIGVVVVILSIIVITVIIPIVIEAPIRI